MLDVIFAQMDLTEWLRRYLPVILIVGAILAVMPWLLVYLDSLFRILKSKKMKYFDKKVFDNFEILFFYVLFLVVIMSAFYATKSVVPELEVLWNVISPNLKFGVAAFVVGLVALVLGAVVDSFSKYSRRGEPFAASLIDLLFFILKYTVYSIALVIIILLELAFFGWESVVGYHISNFFASNMASILFLVIFVIISWFIFSMVTSYIESMYSTERRTMSEAYQFLLGIVRYVFTLMLTVVVIFTLLSMAGLQVIGFLVVGLIMVFIVVAVYVIGSTAGKNLVPGLLLMYYKPFEIGDRILIEGNVYTVQEFGLVQTELRTADGMFIDMPNSKLISETVVNLSRSKKVVVHARLTLSAKIPLDRIRSVTASITSQTSEIENIVVESSTASDRGIVYDLKIILPLEADAGKIRTEVIHSIVSMMKEEG